MRKQLLSIALLALAPLGACKSKSDPAAADNTAKNDRDRAVTPTADQAGGGNDVDITQKIRKVVVGDDKLSTNAHNCKIVVKDGVVTLVGPVASKDEGTRVAELASSVVGAKNVINQLEVTN